MSADKPNPGPDTGAHKETSGTDASLRKPYVPPRLTIYGSIQKLTNTTSMGTKGDGGAVGMNMRTCL